MSEPVRNWTDEELDTEISFQRGARDRENENYQGQKYLDTLEREVAYRRCPLCGGV